MNEELYLSFENYLSNEFSSEEIIIFENRLQNDIDFKEKFETYKESNRFLKIKFSPETVAFKENLKAIAKESLVENKSKKGKTIQLRTYIYAIAAVFVLFFGLHLFQNDNPEYGDFNKHEEAHFTERGDLVKSLKLAQDAFNKKDYKKAIINFELVIKEYPRPEIKYFYAISLLEENRFADSEIVLNDIINGKSIYKNTATWYLALSKLKQKDYKSCKAILLTIPSDYEDYTQVEKLLKSLD
ncbi:MAG: tetratricopeptide repeat protein [Flavobacterium sp.]|uniref:tetratricopeptide repeat protein n=1 Tax=Flavobacterium sp. TaxID=239 RepID=UPI003264C147